VEQRGSATGVPLPPCFHGRSVRVMLPQAPALPRRIPTIRPHLTPPQGAATIWCAPTPGRTGCRSRSRLFQQLRPVSVPGKTHSVDDSQCAQWPALAVYGDGQQVRDWLYVEDHCEAVLTVLQRGRVGETYNVGGDNQPANLEIVQQICALLDELRPASPHVPHAG